jgi:hypothetical protein
LGGIQVHLLQYIRGIDAPLQARIETYRHHPAHAVVVLCEQLTPALGVAIGRSLQPSVNGLRGCLFHLNFPR